MSLTDEIKDFALSIGYDRVGITTADDFPFLDEQIAARPGMYEWAVNGAIGLLKGISPTVVMPSARSIIVTVADYFKESFPHCLDGRIGKAYQARCYRGPSHVVHRVRYSLLRNFLKERGLTVARGFPVPARLAGARAGVSNFGRNNFAFADEMGSYIDLNTFVVDAELEYDQPTFAAPCPNNCRLCVDSCPTGALWEPFRMNPRQCVAYNSYAISGSTYGDVPEAIPLALRERMGTWVFGCDVCQDVCPRNQRKLKAKLPRNEYLARIATDFDLDKLLHLTDERFSNRVMALLYYIPHKKFYQRNAAVALGNLGDPEAVPTLTEALFDPEPIVRGHSAWALGMIGGLRAREALERALRRESETGTSEEIVGALARA